MTPAFSGVLRHLVSSTTCLLRHLTYRVAEEEEAEEEAEQVSSEQGEVDCSGAGHPDHHGHAAVEDVHAEGKPSQEQS